MSGAGDDPLESALAAREESARAVLDMRRALDDAVTNLTVALRRHERDSRCYLDLLEKAQR